MNAAELRALQAPLKQRYQADPASALVTLTASAALDQAAVSCRVETGRALVEAGLHPATGGTGAQACSGDMLLQALVACAGVTLRAVATAIGLDLRGGTVRAEGDLDFRGTLGVGREAPVGFRAIRLTFDLDSDAPVAQLDKLLELTERYCVVLQTLRVPPEIRAGRTSPSPGVLPDPR
jgi:uncharacterized OsmC-like protein